MSALLLHFNVFESGKSPDRRSVQVEDPDVITVAALRQYFPDALQEQRTIRFISSGRMLSDDVAVAKCALGQEAHIHVSIGAAGSAAPPPDDAAAPAAADAPRSPSASAAAAGQRDADGDATSPMLTAMATLLGGVLFFLTTFALLFHRWQKRRQLSMQSSQLTCILGAVWFYALLCHGAPAFFQALRSAFRTSAAGVSSGRGAARQARISRGDSGADAAATHEDDGTTTLTTMVAAEGHPGMRPRLIG